MNMICRMYRITLYNFRQDEHDLQDVQDNFLKTDRMYMICRMNRITLYNFRQDVHDLQDVQDYPL